ncbi:tetratricopeptide repeat-containing sensor histidine kinase [Membranihabitans maritimus]|uniref:tetratricopeptide repeat-containing sensor histidine kinase n=1 Tax=Membranihabitans maritimus TaxID=2904244 RepID=UPI001F417A52|nr:sensor histidine kinase [Membranihabitans maritimus]
MIYRSNWFLVLLIWILTVVSCSILHGQVPRDSIEAEALWKKIVKNEDHPEKVEMLTEYGYYMMDKDVDSAGQIFREVRRISEKISYSEGIINYYTGYTNILNYNGEFEEGLKLNLESIDLAQEIEDRTYLAKQLGNTGISYSYVGQFEKGIEFCQRALEIYEKLGMKEKVARVNYIIGAFFNNMSKNKEMDEEILNQAIEYFQKARKSAREVKDSLLIVESTYHLGLANNNNHEYEKSVDYLEEAIELAQKLNLKSVWGTALITQGSNYRLTGEWSKAIEIGEEALEIVKNWGSELSVILAEKELALAYSAFGDTKKALSILDDAIKRGEGGENMVMYLDGMYMDYGENLAAIGEYEKAYKFYVKGNSMADSLRGAEMKSRILELEEKYKTAQKDRQIMELSMIRQKNQWLIAGLFGGLLFVLGASYFLVKRWRYKAKISEQEKQKLKQEQQLRATESVIRGQEEERTRLARDLHDGLGGLLSGLKYTLNNMDGNVILSGKSAISFTKAMDQLDNAISEMRKVAHNMMPEALVKFGLDDALTDFTTDIVDNSPLQIHYQSYGYERMEPPVEITLYRIIQEAINNTMKHARASDIFIQLRKEDNTVTLSIEDNGEGFDTNEIGIEEGMGLRNIRNRVAYLNGNVDISSSPGQGTVIVVEIMI